jgi:hypothetical protein
MIRKKIYTLCLLLSIGAIYSLHGCKEDVAQVTNEAAPLEADLVYRPLFHHFSSTGCTPCGRLGVPTIKRIEREMGDSVLTLITHFKYGDPFITESSKSIEQAILFEWYSPQLWVNNENISPISIYNGVDNAVIVAKNKLREAKLEGGKAFVGVQYTERADNRFDVEIIVQNGANDSATYFVEIYTMEDSLIAAQAGNDPYVATHYGVNRGGYYGKMGKEIKLGSGEKFRESLKIVPCYGCTNRNLYFYLILWEKLPNGKYGYVNGKQIRNE